MRYFTTAFYTMNGIRFIYSKQSPDSSGDCTSSALECFKNEISACQKCLYGPTRTKFVFGEGNPHAKIMFIGEGPGADEDRLGRPFIGRAGQLLTKVIEEEGLPRAEAFIANIVKCRPFNNEDPQEEAIQACFPYLDKQIELVAPRIIVVLGKVPGRIFFKRDEIKITVEHGMMTEYKGIPVILAYHPSFIVRNNGGPRLIEFHEDIRKAIEFSRSN